MTPLKVTAPMPDRDLDDLFGEGETGNNHAEAPTKMPKGGRLKDSKPAPKVKARKRPRLKEDEDDSQ